MITAVEEAGLQHRDRSRKHVGGPAFSVPDLGAAAAAPSVGFGTIQAPFCLPTAAAVSPPPASLAPTADLSAFAGRSVGTGQCVALVQAAVPGLGPTAAWSAGAAVQGNTSLLPGTPIATFDAASHYANALDGSSHAALYLGQDANGIQVLDQWSGKAASVRTIPWSNPGAAPANTASAYRVVTTG